MQVWRDRAPGDVAGLHLQIRLLVLAAQMTEAVAQAEQTIVGQLKELEERQADQAMPAAQAAEAQLQREFDLTHAVAQAFLSALALDRAEAWAKRALSLAQKMAESKRRS